MTELTVTLLRIGFLVLLWFFVFSTISVLRRDLYGIQISARKRASQVQKKKRGRGAKPAASPHAAATGHLPVRTEIRPRQLLVTEGPLAGTTLPLSSSGILIGRAPNCTLVLDDDYASTRHARLFPSGDDWVLEDLGSTNGTFIGTARVIQPTPIAAGVPVRIGRTVLELRR